MQNMTIKQMIDEIVAKAKSNTSLAKMPFALQIAYDDDVCGIAEVCDDTSYTTLFSSQYDIDFYVEYFDFPCVQIKFLPGKIQFYCTTRINSKTMSLEEVASAMKSIDFIDKTSRSKDIQLTMVLDDAQEYDLRIPSSGVYVESDVEPNVKMKFAAFGRFDTYPIVNINGSEWANSIAYDIWEKDRYSVAKIADNRHFEKDDAIEDDAMYEEDGGGAAAGDAGASAGAGAGAGAGDVAAEMNGAGITTTDVLGDYKPGKGFMGDNFYMPVRAKCPMHHWEIANGGSKRKRSTKNKNKKYAYEKGMKVVVDMFENDEGISNIKKPSYTRDQIANAIEYWQRQLDLGNYENVDESKKSRRFFDTSPENLRKYNHWQDILDELSDDEDAPELTDQERDQVIDMWKAVHWLPAPDPGKTLRICDAIDDLDPRHVNQDYLFKYWIHGQYSDGTPFYIGEYIDGNGENLGIDKDIAKAYIKVYKLGTMAKNFDMLSAWNELASPNDPNWSEFGYYGIHAWNEDSYIDPKIYNFKSIKGVDGDKWVVYNTSTGKEVNDVEYSSEEKAKDAMKNMRANIEYFTAIHLQNPNMTSKRGRKAQAGYYAKQVESNFMIGPFETKEITRIFIMSSSRHKKIKMKWLPGDKSFADKVEKPEDGIHDHFDLFVFNYEINGIECMDVIYQRNEKSACQWFFTYWCESFGETPSTINSLEDLQKKASYRLRMKEISCENVKPTSNAQIDDIFNTAKEKMNPLTNPKLQYLIKRKEPYPWGRNQKTYGAKAGVHLFEKKIEED